MSSPRVLWNLFVNLLPSHHPPNPPPPRPPPLCLLQEHIFKLMKSDSYARFLRSNIYQDLLLARKKVSRTRRPRRHRFPISIFLSFHHFASISVTSIHFAGLILDTIMQLQRHVLLEDVFINICTSINDTPPR